jgi:Fe-S-cluster containining protein
MKLPILQNTSSLCDQCVALCCRYVAFAIDTPKTHREFEDLRWYLLHEDIIIFVEEGEWYVQINRKCKELLPDNRCGIYHNRPSICREYTTEGCDWHGDEYEYDHLFVEPEQIQRFAKEYLAKKRRRRAAAKRRSGGTRKTTRRGSAKKIARPIPMRKSA